MTPSTNQQDIQLAIPKGRMYEGVVRLLADAGVAITATARGYRPAISLPDTEVKILKPQNIVEMLQAGTRDVGFAGADWVAELEADVVEVVESNLDPVRLVAAAPTCVLESGSLPDRRLVVAGEFERLTRNWIDRAGLNAEYLRSFGATEVFPPEDADCIVDVAATGATLRANDLVIIDEVMRSSTRLYASRAAWADARKRQVIEDLALLLESVLNARQRVMLEVNVESGSLEAVVASLPCMREPTIASLHSEGAFSVKAAVPRSELAGLIPKVKARGGTDLVISPIAQVVA